MSYKDAFSFCGRARDFNSSIHRDIIAFVCEFVCETIQATNYHYWVSIFSETGRQDLLKAKRLLEFSVKSYVPYDPNKSYEPEELESYDAMSFRFEKFVETALSFCD